MFHNGVTAPATAPATETVEAYRRYPSPEVIQITSRRHNQQRPQREAQRSPVASSSSSSPASEEPVAPRHRTPVEPSSESNSPFSEGVPEATPHEESGEETNANKRGNYKAASLENTEDAGIGGGGASAATKESPNSHSAKGDGRENAQQQQQHQEGGIEVPSASSSPSISVRLRWGFEVRDLRRVYAMHEDAFPLSYGPPYYQWLLDHDACMGLVATVTPAAYAQWTEAMPEHTDPKEDDEEKNRREESPLTSPWTSSSAAAQARDALRTIPPAASTLPLTMEVISERAQMETTLTELEWIADRKTAAQKSHGKTVAKDQEKPTCISETVSDRGEMNACTVVVGFILGQCAYARHDAGHLLTNPTTYIGSFVVDPAFQGCGLGSALLKRFLMYVTRQRPLYAQDYLHYDERSLIALLAEAQVKKRADEHAAGEGTLVDSVDRPSAFTALNSARTEVAPKSSAADPTTSQAAYPSLLQNLVATYFPEAVTWWQDRQRRQQLRARGLPEDAVEAQILRDHLSPDALTDEEAEEVRREAKHFLVQTGMQDVWLHCLPGNVRANLLYAHRGFQLHRVLTDYYDIRGENYDANLLRYSGPVAGSVVAAAETARPGSAMQTAPETASGETVLAPSTRVEVDTVVERHGEPCRAGGITATQATSSRTSHPPHCESGMRRRYTTGSTDTASRPSTAHTSPTAAAVRPTATSLATAAWLSPRTYGVVADVILCTPAEGQEEWQRRRGGTGDGTGRASWWDNTREVLFTVNALGLLCAVLWIAYNVAVTGKVP